MHIYTSYFYKVRFMPRTLLPVSSATWDPKWFHNFSGPQNIFLDKRGVVNGVRFPSLSPTPECDGMCHGPEGCQQTPDSCMFLRKYREKLDKLDFDAVMDALYDLTDETKTTDVCIMVYETPSNPCSERRVIQEWFQSHGVECQEWQE